MSDIAADLRRSNARGVVPPPNWTTRAADEIVRLREALHLIAGLTGLTLLGGNDLEPGRAHELGANKAFEQAASIAKQALNGE
jgi:hypothetical protein